jgi:hypothetical protein
LLASPWEGTATTEAVLIELLIKATTKATVKELPPARDMDMGDTVDNQVTMFNQPTIKQATTTEMADLRGTGISSRSSTDSPRPAIRPYIISPRELLEPHCGMMQC